MRRLIVDGYNVLFREEGDGRSLQDRREDLLRRIDASRNPSVPVIVVFDGRPGAGARARREEGLEVRFASSPRSADDLIVKLVEQVPRRQAHVVTQDRELGARVKSAGGVVVRWEDALIPAKNRRRRSSPPSGRGGKPKPPEGAELDAWEQMFREGGDADED